MKTWVKNNEKEWYNLDNFAYIYLRSGYADNGKDISSWLICAETKAGNSVVEISEHPTYEEALKELDRLMESLQDGK